MRRKKYHKRLSDEGLVERFGDDFDAVTRRETTVRDIAMKTGIDFETLRHYRQRYRKITGECVPRNKNRVIVSPPKAQPDPEFVEQEVSARKNVPLYKKIMEAYNKPLRFSNGNGITVQFEPHKGAFFLNTVRIEPGTFREICKWGEDFFAEV